MLFIGTTLAIKKYASSRVVKIVVDASNRSEALEVANSFIRRHNERVKHMVIFPVYKPFDNETDLDYQSDHPSILIIDSFRS